MILFLTYLMTTIASAQSPTNPAVLAQEALKNSFPNGFYLSLNPVGLLNNASTINSNYSAVTVSQTRGVFRSDDAYCSFNPEESDIVKFTSHGKAFKIEVFEGVSPNGFDCSIEFTGWRLIVKSRETMHSLFLPCQTKDGEVGGGIDRRARREAKSPQPFCPSYVINEILEELKDHPR